MTQKIKQKSYPTLMLKLALLTQW